MTRRIYLCSMTVMLLLILWLSAQQAGSRAGWVKFIPSVLTAVYLSLSIRRARKPLSAQNRLLALGILLIVPSDFFLCFLDTFGAACSKPVGYALFSLVEIVFALWLTHSRRTLLLRVGICLAAEALPFLLGMADLNNGIAVINLSQLAINVVFAWMQYRRQPTSQNRFFALGISLFAGCDYSILCRTLLPSCHAALDMLVWTCYIPCQILLATAWNEGITMVGKPMTGKQ